VLYRISPLKSKSAITGRLQLRTVLALRWIAVIGQITAVIIAGPILGYPLPLEALMATIALLALITLLSQRSGRTSLNDNQSALHFAFDIVQLATLLFFTGGLTNPFAILILAPVTVAAAILSYNSIILLCALAILMAVILAFFHIDLPWPTPFTLPPFYLTGLAVALILAVTFIVTYVFRVAEEARRLSNALHLAQTALEQEQRLASLGALAAAAAHELGSPLGTIAIASKEILKSLPPNHAARADADLLVKESHRCRNILAELAARPETVSQDHFPFIPASALVELAAGPYDRGEIALVIEETGLPSPLLPHRPEIIHGLGNILHNALEAAKSTVKIKVQRKDDVIGLIIEDDGPGFTSDLLQRLGEPYLTDGPKKENHMGLGIFIAQHLIQKSGGMMKFSNCKSGGACVELSWPKDIM